MRNIYTQSGITLIIFLTILVLGTTAVLLSKLNKNSTAFMLEEQAQTARALAQAKDALLGYAMIYAKTHTGEMPGYLPCPDHNGDGSASTCGDQGYSVIGRFPWRTLGLPPLRDGSGECLWYAVSGGYKNNIKQPLTSDTDGLFIVKNKNGTIAGTTEAEQAIAIIFAPGRIIDGQNRATTGNTLCGENAQADDYLDNFQGISNATGDKDIIDNTNDDILKSRTSISANFWVTASPSDTPTFINAPLTREGGNTGKVIFNDTLMLITPKDFEPVYTRMDFWIAKKVTQCPKDYGDWNVDEYLEKYKVPIGDWENPNAGTYRDTYQTQINKYVDLRETKFTADFHQKHADESPVPEPDSADIQDERDKARQEAISVNSKYSWATPVSDLTYTAQSGFRFGRIPDAPSNTNDYMPDTWTSDCLDSVFNKDWWDEWKEMVFYAVDDDYAPDTTTYMWVKLITTNKSNGDWADWVAGIAAPFDTVDNNDVQELITVTGKSDGKLTWSDVSQTKTDTLAKIILPGSSEANWEYVTSMPSSLPNLKLGSLSGSNPEGFNGANFVVLIAGRRLLLNKDSNAPGYPKHQQRRKTTDEKKHLNNYLEGQAKPLNPSDTELNDPEPAPEKWRRTDQGGNLPEDGEDDTIPPGDEIFIRKPIISDYFNDIACYNAVYGCKIPK